MNPNERILLIDCPDEKGLIYKISGVLYDHKLNIVSNQEYVDPVSDHFFMRSVFEGTEAAEQVLSDLEEVLPEQANIRLASNGKRSVVVLATKEPHCLGDLLLRNAYDEFPATISAVISNHDYLEPLVRSFEIPFHHISHENLEREEHEEKILNTLAPYNPAYLVLAKYMRVFTPAFVQRFPNRMINIHHSFLPAFVGASPYKQAFERGVKIIGATAHFVTDDLDEGQIISQDVIPVNHTHTASDMANAGRDVEKIVLSKALKLVLEEKVFIFQNRTVVFE
ncbi:MAG: formyltetrahydrofolate deformylase [Bacteroidetes bacterium]|nr:formyltetrahydrofolate deformylase [Bacteroidota bacterium]